MRLYFFKEISSTQEFLYSYLKNKSDDIPILVVALHQTNGIGSRANKWISPNEGIYFSFAIHKSYLPSDLPLQSSSIYFGWLFLQRLRKYNKHVWLKWPNDIYIGDVCPSLVNSESSLDSMTSIQSASSCNKSDISMGKIGGIMTQVAGQSVVCGMGINLFDSFYASLYPHSSQQNTDQILNEVLGFLNLNSVESSQILWLESTKDLARVSDYMSFVDIPSIEVNIADTSFFTNIAWRDVFAKYRQEFYKNNNVIAHIIKDGIEEEVNLSNCTLCEDGSLMKDGKKFYNMR
ncbi:biotin--[acetyl-CoA-carboxylase] ligase [Helicobacter muridarum]|uniref:Biotin--[acetyl-CoA-carboxylase] ligase n=1 Tax=Helicobacter muridarum TaxID=216 RepID=A0A099TVH3_9HELI|nr:biotin--[acetyl-CoA-carboxylase] ligase [Helicobacter muridarum]TLE01635.1 biotin--[acetyl-CoA-carboxylase] ligase [Helicobacter muridarum]STQ86252.1 biotin-protein ligase [Helicobacter muridarum]